jgi:predicted phosphodiesterase
MIFIAVGDLHLTTVKPKRRVDNYWETQWNKMNYIMKTAKEVGASAILQPGDFFDSHKANNYLKQHIINWMNEKYRLSEWTPIYCVFGQHDMRYHSVYTDNTPLRVLEAAGVVNMLDNEPAQFADEHNYVDIYGASWGQEMPVPLKKEKDKLTLLVTHRMIYQEKLWEKQEDGERAYGILLRTKFDVIVSGDNHQSFMVEKGGRFLINCGSLMRMKSDQLEHRPCFYIINTKNRKVEKRYIPIQFSADVFDLEKLKREKERNEKIEAFVSKLKQSDKPLDLDFAEALRRRLPELDQATRSMIEEIMT